jgi:hypothetical protein
MSGWNVAIGTLAGANLRDGSRNFFLGEEAGADVTDESDLILIGDGVRSPVDYPEGTVILGVKPGLLMAPPFRAYLGPVLFGHAVDWLGPSRDEANALSN